MRDYPSLIKYVAKPNGGQSSARNVGMDMAKGEYISFVDSNNYIEKSFLQQLYEMYENNGSYISMCSMNRIAVLVMTVKD